MELGGLLAGKGVLDVFEVGIKAGFRTWVFVKDLVRRG